MLQLRPTLAFLAVTLLAMLAAGCGSSDEGSPGSNESRDSGSAKAKSGDEVEPGPAEAVEAKTAAASLAITPELTACMKQAGFTQDTPAIGGGLASWSHADGASIVVAASSEAALSVAGTVGTTDSPASVDGARVSTGSPALTSAAAACLDA